VHDVTGGPGGPALLSVLRDGVARTRSELAASTGLARSTVSVRLARLVADGLVVELDRSASTRGRPSALYALGIERRLIGSIVLGVTHADVALTDLSGDVLSRRPSSLDIADGPLAVLDRVTSTLADLVTERGRSHDDVLGIGIGLPGPVEFATGRPISPPIMPGWDQFDIAGHLRRRFDVPVVADNDVNVMALGERTIGAVEDTDFVVVKVATGIGAGVVAGGTLVRGGDGAAGDIGHIRVDTGHDRPCRCGQVGCCETIASGVGIAATLRQMGIPAFSTADVVGLVRGGHLDAIRVVREAGRVIGAALVACICVLNPSRIIVGGELAEAGEPLLAGIREVIYQRSQPFASDRLQVAPTAHGELAGVIGASRLVQDLLFGS
jgi:glucokinase